MTRLWIGVGILILLFAMGVGFLWGSQTFFRCFQQNMEEASMLALNNQWSEALEKANQSRTAWNQQRRFWSAFTDHEPIEEVQNLFSQLDVYEKARLEVDFATVCNHLAHLAEAIDEAHNLKWWTLL